MRIEKLLSLFLLVFPFIIYGNEANYKESIQWNGVGQVYISSTESIQILEFSGSIFNEEYDYLPVFQKTYPLQSTQSNYELKILHKIFEPLSAKEMELISNSEFINDEINFSSTIIIDRKNPFVRISFIPIRKNNLTGLYEKLVHFTVALNEYINPSTAQSMQSKFLVEKSVLADGDWYKISVTETGIYKISQNELSSMGIDVGGIDPKKIQVYGFAGGMLPEYLGTPRPDDLQQLPIYVEGENDGNFGSSDYILFYGMSPHVWKYSSNSNLLEKVLHLYDNKTYYFVTVGTENGDRINTVPSSGVQPNNFITKYNDALHHEIEKYNLLNSGRIWYGEKYDLTLESEYAYSYPDLDLTTPVTLKASAAARSEMNSYVGIEVNDVTQLQLSISGVNFGSYTGDFAKEKTGSNSFNVNSTNLAVKVTYNKPLNSSVGYLDYFTINFKRKLEFNDGQVIFRNFSTANNVQVNEYSLSKANSNVVIWDITNPLAVHKIESQLSSTNLKFVTESDSLEEFIAFDGTLYYNVDFEEKIENQNLHGVKDFDMIIISHPDFMQEASRLAAFRAENDGLSIYIADPQTIYNEFSSGSQDITAIRDFMKHVYDISTEGKEPQYLLLFGDASFDYMDRVENNTNYIPTWSSVESLNPVSSYIKDDFFGTLDGPGDVTLDIGIGRFVVSNLSQAKSAVDKVIHYSENTPEVMGDWRNILCMIADDEDGNLHLEQADELTDLIQIMNPKLNIEKIYLDAYQQVSNSSGESYPGVSLDINSRVDRGAIIMNYIGHGGEAGLAHERILTINDINRWDNLKNMPVFITATCEFSRFDDPDRVSAGEYIFLNKKGGGIALYTTTRATYAGSNKVLNENFYKILLDQQDDGTHKRMGDVLREAKNLSGLSANTNKFVLLGDPSLNFAFPKHNAVALKINDINISESSDTIKALSFVTIKGEMQDFEENKLSDFNGTLYPTVFDKPAEYTTLGNDPASTPTTFFMQKNALYKGKASIKDGNWEFSFLAPKDLAYQYGKGRLSLYAHNQNEDASGYYNDVMVGGLNEFAGVDNNGPAIRLFMNDTNFISGGLTDKNPIMLAFVFDENGINTVGSGIGHNIIADLDESESYTLNNFFEAELDNYKQGTITYPFYNLSNGEHTLSLKVWDNYNNSSTAFLRFLVSDSEQMAINSLINYPNPFSNYTTFTFEHNQVEEPIDIKIQIFSLNGQLVKEVNDLYSAGGYKYISEKWDGTSNSGATLQKGMYIYKVLIKNYDGSVVEETNKLVLIK